MDTTNYSLQNLTLSNLEKKMKEEHFDNNLIKDLIKILEQRIDKLGEKEFQNWLYHLDFKCPEEFQDESVTIKMYENSSSWIEEEIVKLEKEIKLSWEEQSEDLEEFHIKARKVQLVIRHRLYEVVLALL